MDNLSKKKLDGARISLCQKHERAYLIRQGKKWLDRLGVDEVQAKKFKKRPFITVFDVKGAVKEVRTKSLIRCLKALIKCLERYK